MESTELPQPKTGQREQQAEDTDTNGDEWCDDNAVILMFSHLCICFINLIGKNTGIKATKNFYK